MTFWMTVTPTTGELPDFADDTAFAESVLAAIDTLVNLDLRGVRADVDKWITWALAGGYRPRMNKRATNADGKHAIRITQDQICAALEPYYDQLDMANRIHFELLERTTRPLADTVPLVTRDHLAQS
jgi:hypothetical protein